MNERTAIAAAIWLCAAAGACASSDDDPSADAGGTAGLTGTAGNGGAPSGLGGSGASAAGYGGAPTASSVGGTAGAGTAGAGGGTGGAAAGGSGGGSGGSGGSQLLTVNIYVHHTCDVSTTPATISVAAGSEFTVNWVNSAASASEVDVAKVDPYNTVPIVIGLEPGQSYHDNIREWCGIFTGTFSFRITGCYEPYYLDVDCDG